MSSKDTNTFLLPAANVVMSPTSKRYQLKTPPHSTQRISNLTALNKKASNANHNPEDIFYTANSSFDDRINENHYLSGSQFTSSVIATKNDKLDEADVNPTINVGMLSPEFSSPNLYESQSMTKPDINIISDSPVYNKENEIPSTTQNPLQSPQTSKKRSSGALPSANKRCKLIKNIKVPDDFVLPEPSELPDIVFESTKKPPFSYASLIGMALLRAPDRRLTLAEIYQWISDHFKFYKKGEVGWQNSIRHNLSLNKAFEKTEKSKEKKGHFWKIVPGYEHIYCNVKETKKSNNSLASSNTPIKESKWTSNSNHLILDSTPKTNSATDTDIDDDNDVVDKDILQSTPTNRNRYPLTSTFSSSKDHLHYGTQDSLKFQNTLGSIPELNIQYSSHAQNGFHNHLGNSPLPQYDYSPSVHSVGSSSVDFTSSFSCRANFELSPLKATEPGPLLEPLTPIYKESLEDHKIKSLQLPSIQQQLQQHSSQLQKLSDGQLSLSPLNKFKTPLKMSSPFNMHHSHNNNNNNHLFPSAKKIWASPSYLDDFYTSPITAPSTSSNAITNLQLCNIMKSQHISLSNSIADSPPITLTKRRMVNRSGVSSINGYSSNEIFGIDICTLNHQDDDHE